jgi:hypothetical protein
MLTHTSPLTTTLDEPVSETLKRDLRAIGVKVSFNLFWTAYKRPAKER